MKDWGSSAMLSPFGTGWKSYIFVARGCFVLSMSSYALSYFQAFGSKGMLDFLRLNSRSLELPLQYFSYMQFSTLVWKFYLSKSHLPKISLLLSSMVTGLPLKGRLIGNSQGFFFELLSITPLFVVCSDGYAVFAGLLLKLFFTPLKPLAAFPPVGAV